MGLTRRRRITKKGCTRTYKRAIRSFRHRGGNQGKKVDLVMARYKEKLGWLDQYKNKGFCHIYIYNKGEDNIQCPEMENAGICRVVTLPNVGVCDNTYLRHIVDHYDNEKEPLANVTIFCPGSTDLGHKKPLFEFTLGKALETQDTVLNTMKLDKTVQDAQYNFTIGRHVTSHMNNRNDPFGSVQTPAEIRPFGAWYEKYFPGKKVYNLSVVGIFAASRKDILANPKSLYEELLRQVNTEKFHEAAHFMERAWSTIIDNPERCYEIKDQNINAAVKAQMPYTEKKGGVRSKKQRGGQENIKFAVMAIFKNEAMGIREWIEHYKWQGVDEILLLDNNSTDDWKEKIKGVEDNVTVIPAPRNHVQAENYVNLGLPWLKEHGIKVLGILDLDEYMFGTDGKNIKQHVQEIFGSPNRPSQFSCRWTMFGSSGHEKQPESIRKSFTWRKKDLDFNIKSVVWVDDIVDLTGGVPNDIHVYYKGVNQHRCNVSGRVDQCHPGIQINHYAIQSKEFFEKVKMTRGAVETAINVRDWGYFERYDHKEEEDNKLRDILKSASSNKNISQAGGSEGVDTEEHIKYIVFYACYFGIDKSIANKIPCAPSTKYDCYYFTNNKTTFEKLKGTQWKGVFIDKPITNNVRNSAMHSKDLKVCPQDFKELQGYKFQCYFDTKLLGIHDKDVLLLIRNHFKENNVVMMVNQHNHMNKGSKPFSIFTEYEDAMLQERYRLNSDKYKNYIQKELNSGLKNTSDVKYETSFILRRAGDKVNEINKTWYDHIKQSGIECQISFFFIQQLFKDNIIPTPKRYRRSEDD